MSISNNYPLVGPGDFSGNSSDTDVSTNFHEWIPGFNALEEKYQHIKASEEENFKHFANWKEESVQFFGKSDQSRSFLDESRQLLQFFTQYDENLGGIAASLENIAENSTALSSALQNADNGQFVYANFSFKIEGKSYDVVFEFLKKENTLDLKVFLPKEAKEYYFCSNQSWGTAVLIYNDIQAVKANVFIEKFLGKKNLFLGELVSALSFSFGLHELQRGQRVESDHFFPISNCPEETFLAKNLIISHLGWDAYKQRSLRYKIYRLLYEIETVNKKGLSQTALIHRYDQYRQEAERLFLFIWKRQCVDSADCQEEAAALHGLISFIHSSQKEIREKLDEESTAVIMLEPFEVKPVEFEEIVFKKVQVFTEESVEIEEKARFNSEYVFDFHPERNFAGDVIDGILNREAFGYAKDLLENDYIEDLEKSNSEKLTEESLLLNYADPERLGKVYKGILADQADNLIRLFCTESIAHFRCLEYFLHQMDLIQFEEIRDIFENLFFRSGAELLPEHLKNRDFRKLCRQFVLKGVDYYTREHFTKHQRVNTEAISFFIRIHTILSVWCPEDQRSELGDLTAKLEEILEDHSLMIKGKARARINIHYMFSKISSPETVWSAELVGQLLAVCMDSKVQDVRRIDRFVTNQIDGCVSSLLDQLPDSPEFFQYVLSEINYLGSIPFLNFQSFDPESKVIQTEEGFQIDFGRKKVFLPSGQECKSVTFSIPKFLDDFAEDPEVLPYNDYGSSYYFINNKEKIGEFLAAWFNSEVNHVKSCNDLKKHAKKWLEKADQDCFRFVLETMARFRLIPKLTCPRFRYFNDKVLCTEEGFKIDFNQMKIFASNGKEYRHVTQLPFEAVEAFVKECSEIFDPNKSYQLEPVKDGYYRVKEGGETLDYLLTYTSVGEVVLSSEIASIEHQYLQNDELKACLVDFFDIPFTIWISSSNDIVVCNKDREVIGHVLQDGTVTDETEAYAISPVYINQQKAIICTPLTEKGKETLKLRKAGENQQEHFFVKKNGRFIYKQDRHYYLSSRSLCFPLEGVDCIVADHKQSEKKESKIFLDGMIFHWDRKTDTLRASSLKGKLFLIEKYFEKYAYIRCVEQIKQIKRIEKLSVSDELVLGKIIRLCEKEEHSSFLASCCAMHLSSLLKKQLKERLFSQKNSQEDLLGEISGTSLKVWKGIVPFALLKTRILGLDQGMEEADFSLYQGDVSCWPRVVENLKTDRSVLTVNSPDKYFLPDYKSTSILEVTNFYGNPWETYFRSCLNIAIGDNEREKEELCFLMELWFADGKALDPAFYFIQMALHAINEQRYRILELGEIPTYTPGENSFSEQTRESKKECRTYLNSLKSILLEEIENYSDLSRQEDPEINFPVRRELPPIANRAELYQIMHHVRPFSYSNFQEGPSVVDREKAFFSQLREEAYITSEKISGYVLPEMHPPENAEEVVKVAYEQLNKDLQDIESKVVYHSTIENIKNLRIKVDEKLNALKKEYSKQEEILLSLANDHSGMEEQAHLYAGNVLPTLSLRELENRYMEQDTEALRLLNPSLSEEECRAIFIKTENLLNSSIQIHRLTQIQNACKKYVSRKADEESRSDLCQTIGQLLQSRTPLENSHTPLLLVFQSRTGLVLREKQIGYLHELMDEWSSAIREKRSIHGLFQFLMGGGKTSVFARLFLRWMRRTLADNKNVLPILVVPSSLYDSVKKNLGQQMPELFDLPVEDISIKRKELHVNACKGMLKRIDRILEKGGFLIAKEDTFPTYYLAFVEQCCQATKNAEYEAFLPTINALSQIISRLQTHALPLFDEVQVIKNPMHETFFPIGEKARVPLYLIQCVREVMSLLVSKDIETGDGSVQNLRELIGLKKGRQTLLDKKTIIEDVGNALAWGIIRKSDQIKVPREFHLSFVRYVTNKMNGVCQQLLEDPALEVLELSDEELVDLEFLQWMRMLKHSNEQESVQMVEALTLVKILVQDVFPTAWKKEVNRNVGRDLEGKGKIAPYDAAKSPLKTEFGWFVSAVVYHFMTALYAAEGVKPDQLEYLITHHYVPLAEQESEYAFIPFEETPTAKEFERKFSVPLQKVRSGGVPNLFTDIVEGLEDDQRLELEELTSHLFVEEYEELMKATTSLFSFIFPLGEWGMTGTPYNRDVYGEMSKTFIPDTSVDREVLSTLYGHAQDDSGVVVQTIADVSSTKALVQALFDTAQDENRVEMVLDLGTFFKDSTNLEVAQEIALRTNKPVLFFTYQGEMETPDAFAMIRPENIQDVQFLKGTKEEDIKEVGLRVGEYVVYVDEKHTTGTDVPLSSNAEGLVTIDHSVVKFAFLQTLMRMRKYGQGQYAKIIMKENILGAFDIQEDDTDSQKVQKIVDQSIINEAETVQSQYCKYIENAMVEAVRSIPLSDLLGHAGSITGEILKESFLPCRDLFISKKMGSLYEQSGALSFEQDTEMYFKNFAKKQLRKIRSSSMRDRAKELIKPIVKEARKSPLSPKTMSVNGGGVSPDVRVTVDVDMDVNVNVNVNVNVELLDESLWQTGETTRARVSDRWSDENVIRLIQDLYDDNLSGYSQVLSLRADLQDRDRVKNVFESNFLVTQSFSETIVLNTPNGKKHLYQHRVTRPVEFMLVMRNYEGSFVSLALAPPEAEDFIRVIKSQEGGMTLPCWVVMPATASPIGDGQEDLPLKDLALEKLLVQANWFNGNIFSALAHRDALEEWLYQEEGDFEEKLAFVKLAVKLRTPRNRRDTQLSLLKDGVFSLEKSEKVREVPSNIELVESIEFSEESSSSRGIKETSSSDEVVRKTLGGRIFGFFKSIFSSIGTGVVTFFRWFGFFR